MLDGAIDIRTLSGRRPRPRLRRKCVPRPGGVDAHREACRRSCSDSDGRGGGTRMWLIRYHQDCLVNIHDSGSNDCSAVHSDGDCRYTHDLADFGSGAVHVWTAFGHSGKRPRRRRYGDLPTRLHERRFNTLHASGIPVSVIRRRQRSATRLPCQSRGFDHPSSDIFGTKAVRLRHVYVSKLGQHLRKCGDADGWAEGVPAKPDSGAIRPVYVCLSLFNSPRC